MTLDVTDAIERCRRYDHAVLSYLGTDGYPVVVAGGFRADAAAATVDVGPLTADVLPADGQRAEVTFSHVRPQPGIGYDERRYVNLWGRVERSNDGVRLAVSRASGWDEAETPFFEYAERNVGTARGYLDDVGARPRLPLWWTVFLATRLPFLTATIVPVALGGAVAAYDRAFAWGWFLLALVAAIAVHLGLNMANDLFDDASGADAANVTPTPFSGGSRVIQYGLVSRRTILVGSAALYAVAVGLGLLLAATRSWWLLAVGAGGLALSLAYTAPPLKLVHRGLGEPVTALGFGPVMVMGTYLAVTGSWSWHAFYASLPVALLIALVLYVNQVPDRIGDAAAGKRTVVVRLPRETIVGGYAIVAATAFVLIAAGGASGYLPQWTLLALLPAPLAVRVWRGLRRWYDDPYALMPVMQVNIGLHLATGVLLVAGYLVAVLAR